MACPFFWPGELLDSSRWARAPRYPLGAAWNGTCHANPIDVIRPEEQQMREVCNCGYARPRCSRFPADTKGDAVRFSIISREGDRVCMIYAYESQGAPRSHGTLNFFVDSERFEGSDDKLLQAQARAFLWGYLAQ